MSMYTRVTKTVNDRGTLVEWDSLNGDNILSKCVLADPTKDWYSSLYLYPEDAKKHFEEHGSIKGYNGPAFSDRLVFDLDSKDFDEVKQDTRKLLNRLKDVGVDILNSAKVYFSGNKGFHVYVYLPEALDNNSIEAICKGLAGDLPTFDPVIYNVSRIFRIPNTMHQTSSLFKIEIPPTDLKELTHESVKARALFPVAVSKGIIPVSDISIFEKFKKIKPQPVAVVTEAMEDGKLRGLNSVDFNKCPPKMPRCIFALTHGIMVPGERSRVFFDLAKYYRNDGMPADVAYNTLKGIARLNNKLYPEAEAIGKEEIWNQHIQSAYHPASQEHQKPGSPGIKADNGLIKKYCDCISHTKACILHGKANASKDVYAVDDMHNEFSHFALNADKNVVKTGLEFIDEHMKISRGETTLIVGSNGSGKTTLSLNLLENANKAGVPAVMFSMDMHRNQLFLKLALKCTNYSKNDIFRFYKEKNTVALNNIKEAIKSRYPQTYFVFKGTMTFDEIKDSINDLNAQHNIDIGLALVDYAGRIAGPYSDIHANANYNALRSKEIADQVNVSLVLLAQISRAKGDGAVPLRTSRAAKDSGSWEEAAANVITVWRPFMGKGPKDDVMRVYLAKNRMGEQIEGLLKWDGASGYVGDLSAGECAEYEETRLAEEDALYKSRTR